MQFAARDQYFRDYGNTVLWFDKDQELEWVLLAAASLKQKQMSILYIGTSFPVVTMWCMLT